MADISMPPNFKAVNLVPRYVGTATTDINGDATFNVPAGTVTGYSANVYRNSITASQCNIRAKPAAVAGITPAGTWTVRGMQPVVAVVGAMPLTSIGSGVEVSLVIWGKAS